MNYIFVGQLEAIDPDSKTIYIEFLPLKDKEDKSEVFTVELKKTPKALKDFLKKIKAKVDRKYKTRISSYEKYAKALLDKKLGEIFVQKEDIQKLIRKFNIASRAVEGLVRFSKTIKVLSPIRIGENIYPANSVLRFTHEE
jgi:hypothetical protein